MVVFGCVSIVIFLLIGVGYKRRCNAFQKVWAATTNTRISILNHMLKNSGLIYEKNSDFLIASNQFQQYPVYDEKIMRRNQRKFCYVVDSLPIYFRFAGKEWMIWISKGQCGICSGVEVAIFVKEGIGYHVVSEKTPFEIGVAVYVKGSRCFQYSVSESRLLCYEIGCLRNPEDIRLRARIIFPNTQMLQAFVEEGLQVGNAMFLVERNCNWITLDFARQPKDVRMYKRMTKRWRMFKNRIHVRLYCLFARPFRNNLNRCLFVYYQFSSWTLRRLRLKHL